jgi:hypothetical protein
MANLSYPELSEITPEGLPPASLDALKSLRNQMCESSSGGFKLQTQQRFLRRVLSPDSPTRNVLLVHGTGTGKTCTAIQIAEEYILRPEFQDKKVMVVASAAVQENFSTQLFDMSRVDIDTVAGTLDSKQCTGRKYLDMLLRIESEPKNWNNPDIRDKLERTADKIIEEFYEFMAYNAFGNYIEKRLGGTEADIDREWVHETFDNRMLIIDEAHNIKPSKDEEGMKISTRALENLVKTANGLVLVLLTATPMYDTYDEIVYYMNLFLWNDRKQDFRVSLKATDFFNLDATLKSGQPGETFRKWCQTYVSFVKGENPFTFPFRLPPPKVISTDVATTSFLGKPIAPVERIQYLSLVESAVDGLQKAVLQGTERVDEDVKKRALMQATISVLPGNKSFGETFSSSGRQWAYTGEPCLTPETLPVHAAKFATVLKTIESGSGVCLVYSNFVAMGARLFAMALEEHGYTPAQGSPLLANPAYAGSSKGKYVLLTSDYTEPELDSMLKLVKSSRNRDGSQVRIVVSSKIVSEGVDFRYMRQIHVLDPWWNMSRIEQVIGRGLRTCSHQSLPFEDQNCTVYLHIVRTDDGNECFDEYTYRTKVEPKATKIARVRKVLAESAMDCPLQNVVNTLPEDWKSLEVPQYRSEGRQLVTYKLAGMLAPAFDDAPDVSECIVQPSVPDPDHVRPLSSYLDIRDEILSKVARLLIDKPIWDREQLIQALRPYTRDAIIFNLQQAISSAFRFKDSFNRPSLLESKGDLYALAPSGIPNGTMVERISQPPVRGRVDLPVPEAPAAVEVLPEVAPDILTTRSISYKFPGDARSRFSQETLNGFIFDHELTDAEKRALLRTKPVGLPFADRLYVPDTDYIIFGEGQTDPPEAPIGDDRTKVRDWTTDLLSRFIAKKETLFGSLKNGKFTLTKMIVQGDGSIKRKLEKTGKKFEPIVCGTGDNDKLTMLSFAKYIDAKGVGTPKVAVAPGKPPKDLQGTDLCNYIELLCREEHNCMWVTPEELSVLYENPENKAAFTEAFRK